MHIVRMFSYSIGFAWLAQHFPSRPLIFCLASLLLMVLATCHQTTVTVW